jgi:hypothetical protein
MKREYEMTQDQLETILRKIRVAQSTPVMLIGGVGPESPQEAANRAWCDLGREMGFKGMTVEPSNKGLRFFTAEPVETDAGGRTP